MSTSGTKKQTKAAPAKRSASRKTAVRNATAKAPVKSRRTPEVKKAPARRAARTVVSKVTVEKLIAHPMDYSVPAGGARSSETGKPVHPVAAGVSARKTRTNAVWIAAVCAAALIVAGVVAIGGGDAPAGAVRPAAPAASETAVPGSGTAGSRISPVSVAKPRAAAPAASVNPSDVSWASGVIRQKMNRIAGIYSVISAIRPGPSGTLAAHLEVEPDGHVGRAWLESSTIADIEFSGRILRELITARFDPTGLAHPVGLIVPIDFGLAGTKLLTVAAHNARMPGDVKLPESTVAGVSEANGERNS